MFFNARSSGLLENLECHWCGMNGLMYWHTQPLALACLGLCSSMPPAQAQISPMQWRAQLNAVLSKVANHGHPQLTGQNLGHVLNSRRGYMYGIHLCCNESKQPYLKLKTHPKPLLFSLPLQMVYIGEICTRKCLQYRFAISLSLLALATLGVAT